MEQQQYLIDSNAVIDYLGNLIPTSGMVFLNDIVDLIPNISVITKIEVLGFNAADVHYKTLVDFVDDAVVFDLTEQIVDITIQIRKKYKTKLPDAIIAATAMAYNLKLISRNHSDFKNIGGLEVINPYNL